MKHLEDNLGGVGWALSSEQVEKLDSVSARPLPYPHREIANFGASRVRN